MSRYPRITNIIRGVVRRMGYSDKEFSELIGMPYQTLLYRYRNPKTWRFYEWGAVLRELIFSEGELQEIRKELAK